MIRLAGWVWLAVTLPMAAFAQPVQVSTGEHDGFTRLVLEYGAPVDWGVGRTMDGYEVRLTGARPVYDLSEVYDPIGRRRLASVWVDPVSGALRIGIGCACHAQPFEFRPGIVVIDLKDGPPPPGSTFEMALSGEEMPDLAARPAPRPRARPARLDGPRPTDPRPETYDWTALALDTSTEPSGIRAARPTLPSVDPELEPLREVLLQQLSRGAAQGVVEMAKPPNPPGPLLPEAAGVQVHVAEKPGLRIGVGNTPATGLTAEGMTCIADEKLDLGSWGDDRPVSEQMAEAMSGLIGEFDAPDPAAELRAARFLLFIGFGAEARQILQRMSGKLPDAAPLASLAHILDGSRDPTPAFAGMAACDTAAALWALLADPPPVPGSALDRAAVLRSFSALPVHLRRWLGPPLVDRLLALDDPSGAQAVRDAILRAPGEAGPGVALMEARMDLAAGDPKAADARITPLITEAGPATAEALITQVETHLARRTALDSGVIPALEAMVHERRNTEEVARFAGALTRARALAGDFDRAFAELGEVPEAERDVWTLLAETGPDSALLAHAIRSDGTTPTVPMEVASTLARRLSALGFADQAQAWLRQVPTANGVLAARIALQTGDARKVMRLVAGAEDPELEPIRQEALRQLAKDSELADRLASAGDEQARWRAVGRARDWLQLADAGPEPWQPLAAVAVGSNVPNVGVEDLGGPLARGQALITSSSETRALVAELLGQVAAPDPAVP